MRLILLLDIICICLLWSACGDDPILPLSCKPINEFYELCYHASGDAEIFPVCHE